MELRDYQISSINKIRTAFKNGYRRPILRLDCGAGKTITSATMCIETAKRGKEVLFLIHRQELLQQTIATFKSLGANLDLIKIGMIITVGNHLEDYNPTLIIADECNFALSKTWLKVLNAYPNAYVIGLSATPIRLSGEPMGNVFDFIVEDITAEELIKRGNLCHYDMYAPKTIIDTQRISMRGGDFASDELDKIMSNPKIYGDVLKYFKQYADKKRTIAYCTSVKHAEQVSNTFNDAGYTSSSIDAKTPKKERERIIEDFKNGKIQILCNCDLISFGFDVPDCDCILLLRPTQSLALYIQQSMRCLRGKEGKRALILDFVGNAFRHGMPTEKREWSLVGKVKCKNRDAEPDILVRQCTNCYRCYKGVNPICPYCGFNNGKTRGQIEEEKKAELEKITEIERKDKRKEIGMTKDEAGLIALAKERGYKSPHFYAKTIMKAREAKKR